MDIEEPVYWDVQRTVKSHNRRHRLCRNWRLCAVAEWREFTIMLCAFILGSKLSPVGEYKVLSNLLTSHLMPAPLRLQSPWLVLCLWGVLRNCRAEVEEWWVSNRWKSGFSVLMATIHVATKRKTVHGRFPSDNLCSFLFFTLIVFCISQEHYLHSIWIDYRHVVQGFAWD